MKRIIILILFIFGCTNPIIIKNQSTILPLAVGNFWIYRTSYFNLKKQITEVKFDTVLIKTDTVSGDNGFIYCVMRKDSGLKGDMSLNYKCFNSSDGFHSKDIFFYKYPVAVNDSFNSEFGIANVESIHTKIYTSIGTLECIKYSFVRKKSYEGKIVKYHYVFPGLGTVRTENYYSIDPYTASPDSIYLNNIQELIDFHIY
ncbi:MAG: hypothetical protein NT007_05835 [Candidatus Kapabacteria bacterium]|nr:hypothetical protein [Candidatus Kapabacteria bacterium]